MDTGASSESAALHYNTKKKKHSKKMRSKERHLTLTVAPAGSNTYFRRVQLQYLLLLLQKIKLLHVFIGWVKQRRATTTKNLP